MNCQVRCCIQPLIHKQVALDLTGNLVLLLLLVAFAVFLCAFYIYTSNLYIFRPLPVQFCVHISFFIEMYNVKVMLLAVFLFVITLYYSVSFTILAGQCRG